MSKAFLAFDIGASSGRAIIGKIDKQKITLNEVHRFGNGPMESDNELFWDYNSLCAEIKTGLKKALAAEKNIAGIGIDTWGVDYLFVKSDGSIARLPYNYRDSRTDGVPDEVFSNIISECELYSETGMQLMQLNTIYQLYAHQKAHGEDFNDSKLLFIPDALAYSLHGNCACEYTEASTSNLLDPKTRDWNWKVIDKMNFPRSIFCDISHPGTRTGVLSAALQKELDCPPIPVFAVGSHDTASAIAAVPAPDSGDWAYISCGTWALLGAESDTPDCSEAARLAKFTNEGGLDNKITFLTNIVGTWLFQECKRIWNTAGANIDFSHMSEMAQSAEPCKFLLNPNAGEFLAPENMPQAIKDYCRRTSQGEITSDAEILRCIYDSLALCFRERLTTLGKLLNKDYQCLNIVGGGTQDKLLMQLTADALGFKVVAGPVEATATGNILAQAMACGEVKDIAGIRRIVRNSFAVETFEANPEIKTCYDKAMERFLNL